MALAAPRASAMAAPTMAVMRRDMLAVLLCWSLLILRGLAHFGWSQTQRRADQHQAGNDKQPKAQGTSVEYRKIAGRHLERGAQRFFQERPEDQTEHQRGDRQVDLAHAVAD